METNNSQVAQVATTAPVQFNFFDKEQFAVMQRVSMMFANSELVPDMYKVSDKNPVEKATANCMIAIEMAQRIGASPLMVMQHMVVIYGRPSWSSSFLVATVNTCGRFEPLKYKITNAGKVGKIPYTDYVWDGKIKKAVTKEFDGTQIDNLQCIAYTTAKGSSDVLESATIDVKMAIQEGWYTKAGSKWVTMTRQMLMYRSASFWTRAYAPELSMGMKTDDEIRDIIDVDYEDVTTKTVDQRVEDEKAEKANKKTISLDDEPAKQAENQPEQKQDDKQDQPKAETATQGTKQPAEQANKAGDPGLFPGGDEDADKPKEQRKRNF